CVADPRGFPTVWSQRLELDVARHQSVDRPDAERFDAQLLSGVADPALARKAPVTDSFDVHNDFGSDFGRLVGFTAGPRRAMRSRTIEPAPLDLGISGLRARRRARITPAISSSPKRKNQLAAWMIQTRRRRQPNWPIVVRLAVCGSRLSLIA